ncbi:MarR family transcriptional regulator [Streptomyces sp. NRRL WC-3742]|uniref:MarR family transcriptional regulator n=1 Tax=Streptomyces sp. NRRL WC-3742 TaxID=1463934 RepID=UPI0004C8B66D|nr:helix-turn-helix domain-containing protein [Streptomyces sp. NRRL WC-3742]
MSTYGLDQAPNLPTTDWAKAACAGAPGPFDALVMAKGAPSSKHLAQAAGICGSCPLNTVCSARIQWSPSRPQVAPSTHQAVLAALADAPAQGITPARICEVTGLGQSAVYKAVGVLLERDLARRARHGRYLPARRSGHDGRCTA